MPKEMDKYHDDYIRESKEHVNGLNNALLLLEGSPNDQAAIDSLFRHAHTLKSMSSAMKFQSTATLCHSLEDLLDIIKKAEISSEMCIDVLFQSCDVLSKTIAQITEGKKECDTKSAVKALRSIINHEKLTKPEGSNNEQTVAFSKIEKVRSIEVKVERIDRLMNLSEAFLINRMQLDTLQSVIKDRALTQSVKNLDFLINELQYHVIQARLVPLDYIFNRFPRMVRDLAKQQKKTIDLQIQGASIELDRAIIDALGECLVHFIRNAVDHGIESKKERLKSKKFELSILTINAYRKRNKVMIEVSDDGLGLSLPVIRKKAIEMKLISKDATDELVMETIFTDLSTSDKVSTLSGRGIGLNIVKRQIESLGGRIEVKSQMNKGTTFVLELPLTLAIIRVLFVKVNKNQYAIPVSYIIRLVKVPKSRIKKLMHSEAIVIDKEEIPILRLTQLFNEPSGQQDKVAIVVITHKEKKIGLLVDKFNGMQDVVIKPMSSAVKQNRYFSGSTLVGDGSVSLILDILNISNLQKQPLSTIND